MARCKIARPKAFDREKALIQALQLFWRKGYAATSVEDLVQTLQLSRSSLYDTFGDKRTLFIEALNRYSKRVIEHVAHTLKEAASPLAGIRTLLDELIAGAGTEVGARGCFMLNSIAELVPYDSDVTEMAAGYTNTFQQLLAEALAQAASQNMVTGKQTPAQLAAYVFNTIQGMRILIKSGAPQEQVQAISDLTMDSLR